MIIINLIRVQKSQKSQKNHKPNLQLNLFIDYYFISISQFYYQSNQRIIDFRIKYKMKQTFTQQNRTALRQKIYEGIPKKFKAKFWQTLTNLNQYVKQKSSTQKSYHEMSTNQSQEHVYYQKDISRTILGQDDKKYELSLKKLVKAFCNKFPQIGYHSGMTFFMFRLIQVISDQQAFWLLVYIFEKDTFNKNMIFAKNYDWQDQFEAALNLVLKKANHECWLLFEQQGYQSRCIYFIWLKTFFMYRIPTSLSFKIWELYLLQGPSIWLFAIASIISTTFNIYQEQQMVSQEQFFPILVGQLSKLQQKITAQVQKVILKAIEFMIVQEKGKIEFEFKFNFKFK